MTVINILIILILSLIVYQDIKYRSIPIVLFIILAIMFIVYGMLNLPPIIFFRKSAFNLLFLFIQLILLIGYYYSKGKSLKTIINVLIGVGDIVLLVVFTFAFSGVNFIVFYLSGMVFSLVLGIVIRRFSQKEKNVVPLAGLISIYFILIVLGDILNQHFERLNDNFIIHLIYG